MEDLQANFSKNSISLKILSFQMSSSAKLNKNLLLQIHSRQK